MSQWYRRKARSTFLVYPIARIGRSLEGDRLRLFFFANIYGQLDGKRARGRSTIYNTSWVREHSQGSEIRSAWKGDGLSLVGAIGQNLPFVVEWDTKARSRQK